MHATITRAGRARGRAVEYDRTVDRARTTSPSALAGPSAGLVTPVRLVRLAALVTLAALATAVSAAGCGGGDADPCVSAQCLPGNTCIATAGEKSTGASQCRFPCATHDECPDGYHCDVNA